MTLKFVALHTSQSYLLLVHHVVCPQAVSVLVLTSTRAARSTEVPLTRTGETSRGSLYHRERSMPSGHPKKNFCFRSAFFLLSLIIFFGRKILSFFFWGGGGESSHSHLFKPPGRYTGNRSSFSIASPANYYILVPGQP